MFRIMWRFFTVGVLNEIQYRVNFFLRLLQSIIAVATGLIGLSLVFSHTSMLNGWTRPALLAVMGIHVLMGGIINTIIQPNMQRLMDDIQHGTLDFAVIKPIDTQIIISSREYSIWSATDILVGLTVLIVALAQIGSAIGLLAAGAFLLALFMGSIMIYCFWLILTTGAFWVVRMDNVLELFNGVYQAGRWPVTIYPNWLRIGLTFLVPVAFAVTVPAEAVTHRLDLPTLLLEAGLTVFLIVASRVFWHIGLRHYSGASA